MTSRKGLVLDESRAFGDFQSTYRLVALVAKTAIVLVNNAIGLVVPPPCFTESIISNIGHRVRNGERGDTRARPKSIELLERAAHIAAILEKQDEAEKYFSTILDLCIYL